MAELLEKDPQPGLEQARTCFEHWCQRQESSGVLPLFRARLQALRALRDQVLAGLACRSESNTSRLLDNVVPSVNVSKQPAPPPATTPVAADQLYRTYLPRFLYPIDTSGLEPAQKRFLALYYNAEADEMVDAIRRAVQPLSVSNQLTDQVIEYLLLFPLLHKPASFDVDMLNRLPGWTMDSAHLAYMIDYCLLRLGRLDAAFAIASRLAQTEATTSFAVEFYESAGTKCQHNERPDLAVACMRMAIAALPPRDPRTVEMRFRICDIWANVKNVALAAGEAGDIARDFAGTEHAGKAMYLRIAYLAQQGDDKTVLREVDRALASGLCGLFKEDLTYLKWQSLRTDGQGAQANRVARQYFTDFPTGRHGAAIYYALAIDCLASGRYADATRVLDLLVEKHPKTHEAGRAARLIERIKAIGLESP